ncbi:MAG: hydrogenase nickel incorporation protein HypB [Candidatus Heimdallarchaeota archaeon]|nr:hydrogenase nickel incorporation protein HypB [Candidatus Heimdallarchaeota archaeon]MBY8994029.1 hydrogenase nickel incorporation protein HypB [Candidatus Heimdallarchaeota archaeon]
MNKTKQIPVLERVAKKNEIFAKEIREIFRKNNIICFNIMGSPGCGKTTFIENTILKLRDKKKIAVIEGDLATTIDADRIRELGVDVFQINTGAMCHLDARLILDALSKMDLSNIDYLFVENVGNLVCPSSHDLGEDYRIILASVPEGPHKPKKYPVIYKEADVVIITKADLLEHFPDFTVETLFGHAKEIKHDIITFKVALKGSQIIMDEWIQWLENAKPKDK